MSRDQRLHSDRPQPLAPEISEPHFVRPDRLNKEPLNKAPRKPQGFRRALTMVGAILGTTATVVVATVGGVVLHIGLPPARRVIAGTVNSILGGAFMGQVHIQKIDRLGLDGLDGLVATITDPQGHRVLFLEGAHVRISLPRLVLSAIAGKGDIQIKATELGIDHVEVVLQQEADGSFTLVHAFDPKNPTKPAPTDSKGRGVAIDVPKIAITSGWVHGGIAALPVLDADLREADAAFGMTGEKTELTMRRFKLSTRGMPQNANLDAVIEAHLVLPSVGDMLATIKLAGTAGGIGIRANGGIDGKKVDAVVDIPRAEAAQIRAMVASAPVFAPATVHVEAHGTLPLIGATAHVGIVNREGGEGTVDVDSHVTIPDDTQTDTKIDATVKARDIDVRGFSEAGPASKIAADVKANAVLAKTGTIRGNYDLHVFPGEIAAQSIPDVHAAGPITESSLSGAAHIAEPGAPIDATYTVHRDMSIDFETRARISNLANLKRVKIGTGSVSLHGAGHIALATNQVTAHVDAQADQLEVPGAAVAHVTVAAIVSGSLADPIIDANVAGSHLKAGGYDFGAFAVTTQGTVGSPVVAAKLQGEGMPTIEAKATLRTQGGFGAKQISLGLSRQDVAMQATIASLKTGAGGAIDVDGLNVVGLGSPLSGSFHMHGSTIAASAHADGIDLVRIAKLLDVKDIERGTVALDVDLTSKKTEAKGHVTIDVKKAHISSIPNDADAHFEAQLNGHKVDGTLDANMEGIGNAKIVANQVDIDGSFLDGKAWKRATGRMQIDSEFDLARAAKEFPSIPVDDVRGWLNVHAIAHREGRTGFPDGEVVIATRELALSTRPSEVKNPDGTVHFEGTPMHTEGVDLKAAATVAGSTGATALGVSIVDKIGTIASLDFKTKLPLESLLESNDLKALALATSITARVDVPERSLQAFPSALGVVPAKGTVAVTLDATGTVRAPRVVFEARTRNIVPKDEATPVPVSTDVVLTYDGDHARLNLIGTRPEGKVIDMTGEMRVSSKEIIDGDGTKPLSWDASLHGQLSKFPIEAVGDLIGQRLKGTVSALIDLRDLHKDGHLDANFDLRDMRVEGVKFPHAGASIAMSEGILRATARIEQADGFADVRATGAMHWGAALAPSLDDTKVVDLNLATQKFRIIALQPFLRETFNQLDGRLDGDAKIHLNAGDKTGTMSGAITFSDGVIEPTAVGEEFHNVGAKIVMKQWGTVRVDDVVAEGVTGKLTASATAQFKGFSFEKAQAQIAIAQSQKLPIAFQGVSYGSTYGTINTTVKMAADGKSMDVDVSIPKLVVVLPQSTGNSVQSLDDNPNVKIGSRTSDGNLVVIALGPPVAPAAPKDAMTVRIQTHLKDIEIKRDTMLAITVTGAPLITSGAKTTMQGQLNVPEGFLEVQGKRFTVEKGTVTFSKDGDPGNPIVDASAAYDAPDGTRVYAEFVGPVKTGKLSLRSEPAMDQSSILSLLLFGSADASMGSSDGSSNGESGGARAAGLAGGVVTQGLNKAISGVSNVEVTTKVDTSDSNDPRPEVSVRLSPKVTAQVSYGLGVPAPGQNPDTTLLSVDWRFIRNWTAEATVGDKGTSILDLTWRYRY